MDSLERSEGRGEVAAYTGQRRKQAVLATSPLYLFRVVRVAAEVAGLAGRLHTYISLDFQ